MLNIKDIVKIIKHHFPGFYDNLKQVQDPRSQGYYKIEEIIFGAISLFLFKCGSRNNYNNLIKTTKFEKNFLKAFNMNIPCMDAVKDVLLNLPEGELESIKQRLIKSLLIRKVLHKYKFKKHFLVAIDGTGIASYDKQHCKNCLFKKYKNGTIKYFHNVLEAKLVTGNGFSVSIATQWIDNKSVDDEKFEKQNCEQKAFKELAKKIKKQYPRLPICICADGLYPNNSFFKICKKYKWKYIVTLKEGNLKKFWKKLDDQSKESSSKFIDDFSYKFLWVNNLEHNGYDHNWILAKENDINTDETQTFSHITNFTISSKDCHLISQSGRLRWKIENEGFNQQKNQGYSIQHKFCRKSYLGMKNFYQACQIAHIINQLVELSLEFKSKQSNKITIQYMWTLLWANMIHTDVDCDEIEEINSQVYQILY